MIEDIDKEGNIIFDFAEVADYERFLRKFELIRPQNGASMILLHNFYPNGQIRLYNGRHYILNVDALQKMHINIKPYDSYLIAFEITNIDTMLFQKSDKSFKRNA